MLSLNSPVGCLVHARSLALATLLTSSMVVPVALAVTPDPVIYSFATVGDTRQDPVTSKDDPATLINGALLPQDAQWLQNTRAWARILRTVQSQKTNLFFVNGDMIMGYGRAAVPPGWSTTGGAPQTPGDVVNSDLVKFYTQYAYWRGMIANTFETNTYVVPVSGNHETQCNSANVNTAPVLSRTSCPSGKNGVVENENAWRANMGDLISDLQTNARFQSVSGFAASNVSGLTAISAPNSGTDAAITTDQSKLSYSFDVAVSATQLLHFVVINTDATSFDSHAPVGWLTADLSAAQSRGATKFYVFGHKPAFTYDYLGNGLGGGSSQVAVAGLDADLPARNAFWKLIAQYNATYFCGHEHTTKVDTHPDLTGTFASQPYQVLVGGGGSPFDPKPGVASLSPTDRYYAWAVVRVRQSGTVALDVYGFNENFGPTQLIQSVTLP